MVRQACKVWNQVSGEDKSSFAAELLPDPAQFAAAIGPFLELPPNPSLAITNSLGGAIHLIKRPPETESTKSNMARDVDGYSPALRMMWYTAKLIRETDIIGYVTSEQQTALWKHISLFLQLASDNISVEGSNDLWNRYDSDLEAEILDLITECQALLASWLQGYPQERSNSSVIAKSQLLEESRASSVASYYSARAYCAMSIDLQELHGHVALEGEAEQLRKIRKSPCVFMSAACLSSASDPKALLRLCNELISDLTGYGFPGNSEEGAYSNSFCV